MSEESSKIGAISADSRLKPVLKSSFVLFAELQYVAKGEEGIDDGRGRDSRIHNQPPQKVAWHRLQVPSPPRHQGDQEVRGKAHGNHRCEDRHQAQQARLVPRR